MHTTEFTCQDCGGDTITIGSHDGVPVCGKCRLSRREITAMITQDTTSAELTIECPRCEQAKRWQLPNVSCPVCNGRGMVGFEAAKAWRQKPRATRAN